jgi:hypothetical protein
MPSSSQAGELILQAQASASAPAEASRRRPQTREKFVVAWISACVRCNKMAEGFSPFWAFPPYDCRAFGRGFFFKRSLSRFVAVFQVGNVRFRT